MALTWAGDVDALDEGEVEVGQGGDVPVGDGLELAGADRRGYWSLMLRTKMPSGLSTLRALIWATMWRVRQGVVPLQRAGVLGSELA